MAVFSLFPFGLRVERLRSVCLFLFSFLLSDVFQLYIKEKDGMRCPLGLRILAWMDEIKKTSFLLTLVAFCVAMAARRALMRRRLITKRKSHRRDSSGSTLKRVAPSHSDIAVVSTEHRPEKKSSRRLEYCKWSGVSQPCMGKGDFTMPSKAD